MLTYVVIAVIAFCCGFLTAPLFMTGRRYDALRAGDLLAEAVDGFAREHGDRRVDEGGRISVARGQIERLQQALALHDELRAS
jgi:hypothetical protein